MNMNEYLAEWLIRERVAKVRAWAETETLANSARQPRRSLRAGLGLILVRIGHWLMGNAEMLPERETAFASD